MPKREYPFDDHLSPQLKVHVGQKQVSNGVNKDREMSKVYEKTLSLLKNGSKEFERKLSLYHGDTEKIPSPEKKSNNKPPILKQMIFDSKLKLYTSETDIDVSKRETCHECATTAVVALTRCFYCNNFKCADCLSECTKCEEHFCDKCSLTVYETGEHTECLACYR